MTFKKFFGYGFLAWLLTVAIKVLFFKFTGIDTLFAQVLFGFLICLATLACCRRLGVINYLEGLMTAIVWLLLSLLGDFLVIVPIVGYEPYKRWPFWAGYLLFGLTIFFFHKKRHVHVRRELAAHHHAHHGGGHGQHSQQHGAQGSEHHGSLPGGQEKKH